MYCVLHVICDILNTQYKTKEVHERVFEKQYGYIAKYPLQKRLGQTE